MSDCIKCLVCARVAEGTYDSISRQKRDVLRERGWQISVDYRKAVCPDCIRDVHEDSEESPANSGFLTWRQLRDVARVSGDEHTHEPESEFGDVPGVVRHLASTLKKLDPQEVARPITELQKMAANAGPKRVEVGCQCYEEAPNYHGGYGVCPIHPDDHQLAGDSIGGHQWQGASADFCLIDEAVDKPSIDEPDSFQDADDDTWYRQEDGGYRCGFSGFYHHQSSLRAAVDYAGLQPDEQPVLDALQGERNILEHKRHAERLVGLNKMLNQHIEELQAHIHELEGQTQRQREVERNQAFALDEQDNRIRVLQSEIARVVTERNELQETVQSKIQQQDEVRRMYSNAVERITFLEEALKTIEKIHRPYERDGRIECEVCGGSGECLTHTEAGAAYDCGRAFPSGDVLLSQLRCVRSKSHLGLHRDTAEKADARYEWDNDGNLM